MRGFTVACLVLLVLCASPRPGVAQESVGQEDAVRSGNWFGVGVGLGSSSLSCTICAADRRSGTAAVARGGFTLNPTVRIGLELSGWARFDEVNQLIWSVAPAAYFHPSGGSLFLKAGPSITHFSASDSEDTKVTTQTFGVQIGAGYETPISSSAALTPYLDVLATSFGSLTSGERSLDGWAGVTLIHLGVSVTFH